MNLKNHNINIILLGFVSFICTIFATRHYIHKNININLELSVLQNNWFIKGDLIKNDLDIDNVKIRLIYISKNANYDKVKLNYRNLELSNDKTNINYSIDDFTSSFSMTLTKDELQEFNDSLKKKGSPIDWCFKFPYSRKYVKQNYYLQFYYELVKTKLTGSFAEIEFLDIDNILIYKDNIIDDIY